MTDETYAPVRDLPRVPAVTLPERTVICHVRSGAFVRTWSVEREGVRRMQVRASVENGTELLLADEVVRSGESDGDRFTLILVTEDGAPPYGRYIVRYGQPAYHYQEDLGEQSLD